MARRQLQKYMCIFYYTGTVILALIHIVITTIQSFFSFNRKLQANHFTNHFDKKTQ